MDAADGRFDACLDVDGGPCSLARAVSVASARLSSLSDEDADPQAACAILRAALGYDGVAFWRVSRGRSWIDLAAVSGSCGAGTPGSVRLDLDDPGDVAAACRGEEPAVGSSTTNTLAASNLATSNLAASNLAKGHFVVPARAWSPAARGAVVVGAFECQGRSGADERDAVLGLAALAASCMLRAERLIEAEVLIEAGHAVGASLDRDEVLRRILHGLALVIPLDSASIMLREGDRVGFVSTAGIDEPNVVLQYPPLGDLHYVRQVLETNRAVVIDDVHEDPLFYRTPLNDYIRSWIGVPMTKDGQAIGLLTLDNRVPGFYTEAHAALATRFAADAAMAVENARLYRDAERRRREAETLREVSAAINASLDPKATLDVMLKELRKVLEFDSACVMQRKGTAIRISAGIWNVPGYSFDETLDFSFLPNVRSAMAASDPILIRDTLADGRWQGNRVEGDTYIRCWMGVPIRVKDETIGLLNLDHHVPGHFDARDLELASIFAEQAATAIQNADLYARAQLEIGERRLAEERTRKANEEKLEFLSSLVAVVAHEVNTPTGVSISAATHLHGLVRGMREDYEAGSVDEGRFERLLADGDEALGIVEDNLQKVAELVRTFKKIAVDQHVDEKRRFDVGEYLAAIVLSMKPRLRDTPHVVNLSCQPGLTAETTPGAIYQILVNMVSNSLAHAFPDGRKGRMDITATARGFDLELVYRDDGVGIPPESLSQVFAPFFTTAKDRGGSGLGLYIVDNLVTKLDGTVECVSAPGEGVEFRIMVPGVVVVKGASDGG